MTSSDDLDDDLRRRLESFVALSASAADSGGGYWVGDAAAARQTSDNLHSGYLLLHQVSLHAKAGILAFRHGDLDKARFELDLASDCYVEWSKAVLTRAAMKVRPADRSTLLRPAKRRGRPSNGERNYPQKTSNS